MKWRECSEWKRDTWHSGPDDRYYVARKGGVRYEVAASWWDGRRVVRSPQWWAIALGASPQADMERRAFESADEAKAWCEQHAAERRGGGA